MKKIKTSLICAFLVISSLIAIPTFATNGAAQGPGFNFDWKSENPEDIAAMPEGMMSALGGIF